MYFTETFDGGLSHRPRGCILEATSLLGKRRPHERTAILFLALLVDSPPTRERG